MHEDLELWLVRHGETEWTIIGAHTGISDVGLTQHGRQQAVDIGAHLQGKKFAEVLTSPRARARETCRLAGYSAVAKTDENLQEWNYGDYEGKATSEIRMSRPNWCLWDDGTPGGEGITHVAARAAKVIEQCLTCTGPVLLFSHAHFLRVLAACWLELDPHAGKLFGMDVASISILGFERQNRVIRLWNETLVGSPRYRRIRGLGAEKELSASE